MYWTYEKLDENCNIQHCPACDYDGSLTGHIVIGVKAWFDENPEERKRLGWIKHVSFDHDEIKKKWPHNPQTQILIASQKMIDEYTIEDEYHVINKSEEILRLEELVSSMGLYVSAGYTILDAHGGVIV